jgi:uncharacterized protein YjiS (DUF1127 family)
MTIILIVIISAKIVSIFLPISSEIGANCLDVVMVMVTIDTIEFEPNAQDAQAPERGSAGFGIFRTLSQWWMKRSTRACLADLDEALLKDIGITRHDARKELQKSIYLR